MDRGEDPVVELVRVVDLVVLQVRVVVDLVVLAGIDRAAPFSGQRVEGPVHGVDLVALSVHVAGDQDWDVVRKGLDVLANGSELRQPGVAVRGSGIRLKVRSDDVVVLGDRASGPRAGLGQLHAQETFVHRAVTPRALSNRCSEDVVDLVVRAERPRRVLVVDLHSPAAVQAVRIAAHDYDAARLGRPRIAIRERLAVQEVGAIPEGLVGAAAEELAGGQLLGIRGAGILGGQLLQDENVTLAKIRWALFAIRAARSQ